MSSSYIGRSVDAINNISTLDNLSFNGSDATFNLTQNSVAFVPVSADALQIQIDGVIQSGNYTVSGSTVTFDFTPSGSSVCNGIRHYGVGIITSVSDGAVTNVKLGADSVNGSKIADDSISDEHLDITAITGQTAITSLADTDKFLVSDASDSGNLKYVEKQYLGGGGDMKLLSMIDADQGSSTSIEFQQVFSSDYDHYRVLGCFNIGALAGQDMRFRWLNSSNTEQTVSQYYGFASGSQKNNSTNGSFDFGAYGDSFSTIGSDVKGGAYYRKITLDMTLFPDAYASTTYSNIQWQIGYYKHNSGAETVAFANGMNSYTQTADLSGGGIKLYLSANNWDFVTCGLYGIKTVT